MPVAIVPGSAWSWGSNLMGVRAGRAKGALICGAVGLGLLLGGCTSTAQSRQNLRIDIFQAGYPGGPRRGAGRTSQRVASNRGVPASRVDILRTVILGHRRDAASEQYWGVACS